MKKIRINNFYTEIEDTNTIKTIKDDLTDIKEFCLYNEISSLKKKYILSKMIMFLLEVIDILVILSVIFLDNITNLVVTVLILNIIVGILFIVIPDFEFELRKKEKEYDNMKRVIY